MRKISIFDTTLRDGEQAPGNTLSPENKLEIALGLERLGVDTIEAGFPASSREDYKAVELVSQNVKNSYVCALARAKREDIKKAIKSLKSAKKKRLHIFLATSDLHLKSKLKLSRDEALKLISREINYAKKYISDITFGLEDATRSDPNFLEQVIDTAIRAGANAITIADTIGYCIPKEYGKLIRRIVNLYGNKITISTHCHNDLGLATANTLAGVENGANEIQVTMNGIGERGGNTALEEVVMGLYVKRDYYGCETGLNIRKIFDVSKLVYKKLRRKASSNKPIVGKNAFNHEAGVHQDGIQKNPETYELFPPELIGRKRKFTYGIHSGRDACMKHGIKKNLV
ncbi:MAG: 2-isopropylmalate synthase [Nanoarchaeota archaeon]|nr:2-isopropylmalate synthase [Nanoarchaeota archaeon]